MKIPVIFSLLTAFLTLTVDSWASSRLKEEQIVEAKKLGMSNLTYEAFRDQEMIKDQKERRDYLTLQEFNFAYKDKQHKLLVGVGSKTHWGEIAVYPGNVDPQTIEYESGSFNDFGAPYLSIIKFEYVKSSSEHPSYIILESLDAGCNQGRKGFSQACVSYFIDEFVTKHTTVGYVFSDARNEACQHFFPRYGLLPGMPELFETVKFERPAQVPFYWQRVEENASLNN